MRLCRARIFNYSRFRATAPLRGFIWQIAPSRLSRRETSLTTPEIDFYRFPIVVEKIVVKKIIAVQCTRYSVYPVVYVSITTALLDVAADDKDSDVLGRCCRRWGGACRTKKQSSMRNLMRSVGIV